MFVPEDHTDVVDPLITTPDHPPEDTCYLLPHVPMVSQTQDNNEDYSLSEEDPDLHEIIQDRGKYFDNIATHVNTCFDIKYGALTAELESIVDHRFLSGILELQVEYTNGDVSWPPMDLIKDEDLYAAANYMLRNDLGMVSNGIHRRWARSLLRALNHTVRRL